MIYTAKLTLSAAGRKLARFGLDVVAYYGTKTGRWQGS